MKNRLFNILIAIFLSLSSWAQEVNVTATFDSSKIFIGDQIGFTVTIDQPEGINLIIPLFKDTLISKIEIISGPVRDTLKAAGERLSITEKYMITSFDSGFYQVPPVYAEMKEENVAKRFYSDYSRLEVMRVGIAPPDTTARIFDIVAPYKAPLSIAEVLPWILTGAIALAALFFLVRSLRKYNKRKVAPAVVTNNEPAHVTAFRELEKLKEEQLWQKGEVKRYYTRLTEILRTYLENRYAILSLELTTHETLEALVKSGFKKDGSYRLLEGVLKGGDLVKFAKYKPAAEENELRYADSFKFVEMTREFDKVEGVAESESDKNKSTEVAK